MLLYGVGCLAATLVNPYGYKLLVFNLRHNFNPTMKRLVLDWRPLDTKEGVGTCLFLLVLVFLWCLWRLEWQSCVFEVVMLLVLLYMSMGSARHLGYLLPFLLVLLARAGCGFSLNRGYLGYLSFFLCGLSVLVMVSTPLSSGFEVSWMAHYADDELEGLLRRTNADDVGGSDGLLAMDLEVWSLGLQSFDSGAYPATEQRTLDSYAMLNCASAVEAESIIGYYGITKLCFCKWSNLVFYYDFLVPLYGYLAGNPDYVCLYDGEFYCYFVKSSLADKLGLEDVRHGCE